MSLDLAHFTPYASTLGGVMIGAAAALWILGAGRILGASGIFAGAFTMRGTEETWRPWLIAGILAAPTLAHLLWAPPSPIFSSSAPLLALSGLLVGFGSRLGSGCTSGHGLCGIARLSPRSIAATALFMGAGFATVFVVRHALV